MVLLKYRFVLHDGRANFEHRRLRLFLVAKQIVGGRPEGVQSPAERRLPLLHQLERRVEERGGSDQLCVYVWRRMGTQLLLLYPTHVVKCVVLVKVVNSAGIVKYCKALNTCTFLHNYVVCRLNIDNNV